MKSRIRCICLAAFMAAPNASAEVFSYRGSLEVEGERQTVQVTFDDRADRWELTVEYADPRNCRLKAQWIGEDGAGQNVFLVRSSTKETWCSDTSDLYDFRVVLEERQNRDKALTYYSHRRIVETVPLVGD